MRETRTLDRSQDQPGTGSLPPQGCPIAFPPSHMLCLQRVEPLIECSWWCGNLGPWAWLCPGPQAFACSQHTAPSPRALWQHCCPRRWRSSPRTTLGLRFPASRAACRRRPRENQSRGLLGVVVSQGSNAGFTLARFPTLVCRLGKEALATLTPRH